MKELMHGDLLVHLIFVGLAFGLLVYLGFLEWFKRHRGAQGDSRFADYSLARFRRRFLALALAGTVLGLFFAGLYLLPITTGSIAFVLYWWGTFTLTLGLFIVPTLDFLESAQSDEDRRAGEKQVVVRMIHEISDDLETTPETPAPDPGTDDSSGNSTLH